MKNIQILHKGKVYHGKVGYEDDFMEIELSTPPSFAAGEQIICFDFSRRQLSIVLHVTQSKVVVAPADSEIFHIKASSQKTFDELFGEEQEAVKSFKINTFGTITEDFKTRAVRISDVSRIGLGFEVDDFTVQLNEVYESTIFCDEASIRLKLIVRYAHIMEKTIRYGSEIQYISQADLTKLRYFIVMQKFKQLMHV
jgi:hypothetical protein